MEAPVILDVCDFILNKLKDGNPHSSAVMNHNVTEVQKQYLYPAFHTLVDEGYISPTSQNSDTYVINAKGMILLARGGYKATIHRDQLKERFMDELNTSLLSTNKSVQDTNEIVSGTAVSQKWASWISAGVAFVALFIAGYQIFDKATERQLQKLIEQQNQKFESLVKVQRQIERHLSRIITDTLHLTNQPPSGVVDKNLGKASR